VRQSTVVSLNTIQLTRKSFYEDGYKDGFVHGRIHGLIEGRALGREKGYEMFEELGFYEGFALTWKKIYEKIGKSEDRSMNQIKHLLDLISQFPRVNPSSLVSSSEVEELDIQKLFRQIRSRYKALCATLGVRPSIRAAEAGGDQSETGDQIEGDADGNWKGKKVWPVDAIGKRPTGEQLSF